MTGGNGMAEGERKVAKRQQARGEARSRQQHARKGRVGQRRYWKGENRQNMQKTREIAEYLYVIRE
jgi:hypothetical protein